MSEKKKFYKKPAFWIIVVVIVAIVGIAAHQIKQEQEEKEAYQKATSEEKTDSFCRGVCGSFASPCGIVCLEHLVESEFRGFLQGRCGH